MREPVSEKIHILDKDPAKRKKGRKGEGSIKKTDPTPKVDNQNFPKLGGPEPTDSKTMGIFGRANEEPQKSRSPSKNKSKSKKRTDKEAGNNKQNKEPEEAPQTQSIRRVEMPEHPALKVCSLNNFDLGLPKSNHSPRYDREELQSKRKGGGTRIRWPKSFL